MALFDTSKQLKEKLEKMTPEERKKYEEEQEEETKVPCICCETKTNNYVQTYLGTNYPVCEKHRAIILELLYEQTKQIMLGVLNHD